MNRVDFVDTVVDLADVDLDVDPVDVDLADVDLADVDLGDVDLDVDLVDVNLVDLDLGDVDLADIGLVDVDFDLDLDRITRQECCRLLSFENAAQRTSQYVKWTSAARVLTLCFSHNSFVTTV